MIKSESENTDTVVNIYNFMSISERSKLFKSTNQLLKVLLLLKLEVSNSSDNVDIKMLN